MPDYDEAVAKTEDFENLPAANEHKQAKGINDFIALAISTCGVGYIPIAPGTFGSIVGVLIYLVVISAEVTAAISLSMRGWPPGQITAAFFALNLILLLIFCLAGIWASKRSAVLFGGKDPQKIVVDEAMGQLTVFLFIPFGVHWGFLLAGFLLFRLFDIWKPYPIRAFEEIPNGIGVCADDLVAGIYGGICLAVVYAFSLIL